MQPDIVTYGVEKYLGSFEHTDAIVMNSEAELQQAFKELRNGTFIRPAH